MEEGKKGKKKKHNFDSWGKSKYNGTLILILHNGTLQSCLQDMTLRIIRKLMFWDAHLKIVGIRFG